MFVRQSGTAIHLHVAIWSVTVFDNGRVHQSVGIHFFFSLLLLPKIIFGSLGFFFSSPRFTVRVVIAFLFPFSSLRPARPSINLSVCLSFCLSVCKHACAVPRLHDDFRGRDLNTRRRGRDPGVFDFVLRNSREFLSEPIIMISPGIFNWFAKRKME